MSQSSSSTRTKSKKQLGLWMLIALVAGNMIGSGIFLLPASLARIGSISLYSWFLTALGSLVLALVFARMSFLVPKTGGPYAYAQAGFGNFIGFQTAYNYWAALWIGNAAIALALVGYLRVFIPALSNHIYTTLTAIAFVWLLTIVNIIGVSRAGFVQVITTIIKLIPLVLVILFGWTYFHPHYLTESFNRTQSPDWVALSHAASLTLWAFIGLEAATVPAGSVKNPGKTIPIATVVGTLIGAVVYIFSSTVIMGMIPAQELAQSTSPFADAAKVIFGPWGLYLIAFGAAISCFGALNGWTLLQGQVAMAAADDDLFPKWFAKRNRQDTPALGLLITAVLITILLLLQIDQGLINQFNTFILLAVLASLLPYLYTSVAEIILLRHHPQRSQKRWFHFTIAVLAIIYSAWAILGAGERVIFYGMILLITSVPLYACMGHTRKR